MKYMLDTNIIAYTKNKRPASVLERLTAQQPSDVCISTITMAELEFGIFRSSKPAQNRLALLAFLSVIQVLPFDSDAAREYGAIRHSLTKSGTLIGANDMLIAAHAKSQGLILVTNNARGFNRVEGLTVENWV